MRMVLIGQAAFGAAVLEALLKNNEDIAAVYTPAEKPGGRPDPLKELAVQNTLQVIQPETYKDAPVFEQFQALAPDLVVMAFVTDIIPAKYFEVPTRGTINYHPSLLPRHRGASAINWAVIMGDDRTGLSVFWPDGGIDTGPVLLQKQIEIGPGDTVGSLYFNHLFPMGVDAVLEAIELIKAGKAPQIEQDESQATYEPPCDDRVAQIDWRQPGRDLFNLVRGCDPQPGAFVDFKGERIRFYKPALVPEITEKRPGTIVAVDDQGLHIAVDGGKMIVAKVKAPGSKKISASEFAKDRKLSPGDLLAN